jgi:hypothetical protein
MRALIAILLLASATGASAGPVYVPTIVGFHFLKWRVACHALRETYPSCSADRKLGSRCLSIHFSRSSARAGYYKDCASPDEETSLAIKLPLEFEDTSTSEAIKTLVDRSGDDEAKRRLTTRFLEHADLTAALLFRIANEPE